jgi:hypothetical protein
MLGRRAQLHLHDETGGAGMSRAKRTAPNRTATRKPPKPQEAAGWWRGMSPERLQMAAWALGGDTEDTTDEERDALNEYITLGGNVMAL